MCHRPLRAVWMVILTLVLAAPARAQIKPYSEDQIQGLVHDGKGNETGARLIAIHGIDFIPTDDFLESLRTAGANEAFLQALDLAKRLETAGGGPKKPLTAGGGANKPLSEVQIFSLVSGEVPTQRVAMLARERGIDFDPTQEFFRDLRAAGGDDELERALKGAQVSKPERVTPAVDTQQTEIRQHTARASQLLVKKQYADAESEYRAAIQLDPQNSDLHTSLGLVLGREGNWDGQISEDRDAIRQNPNNDRAHYDLGSALSRKNDQQGAMAEYREAIRLNPENLGAHLSLASRLSQMNDWDGAIAQYSEATRLYPNNSSAHFSLGKAYEHQGNRQAALQEYRTAYDLNPDVPTFKQAYERLSSQ